MTLLLKKGEEDIAPSADILEQVGGPQGAPLAKAYFLGEKGGPVSQAVVDQDKAAPIWEKAGALAPPYDPNMLAVIYENSSSLRPNVDAYITGIDSFGHHYVPVLDLDGVDADAKIRDAMRVDRRGQKATGKAASVPGAMTAPDDPTEDEVKVRKEQLRLEMRDELVTLQNFFENCTTDVPFSGPEGLRGLTRQDIEVIGSGYWEVLRDTDGRIVQFGRVPSVSVRMLPSSAPVSVSQEKQVSLLTREKRDVFKRFRTFVQAFEGSGQSVYFKEFGDPRAVSSQTGKAYKDLAEMQKSAEDKDSSLATELIHFKISSPRTSYGVPRWMGTLLAVLGTRQSEEVNFMYFENRSVPPLAVMVSGGRLSASTVERLESYISNQIRGKRNFHKIMILEAETAEMAGPNNTGKMKIELQPLTNAQQQDGLFQAYDERNADKVGQSFRLPRLLRGDVRDFNRSTAEASIDFAEIQVFGPIRQQFDWMINKLILPAIGVKYYQFVSNAPTVRDPEALSTMIKDLVTANVLTPQEARELSEGVFNRPFQVIDAPWTKQPIGLSLAGRPVEDDLHTPGVNESDRYDDAGIDALNAAGGMSTPGAGPTQAAVGAGASKSSKARALAKIHKVMVDAEREEFSQMQREHIKVPNDIFYSFFDTSKPE